MSARLVAAYLAVFAASAGLAAAAFSIGEGKHAQPDISGSYAARGACAGGAGKLVLNQSGQFVDASGKLHGALRFRRGVLSGTVECAGGSSAKLCLRRAARHGLTSLPGCTPLEARFVAKLPKPGTTAKL